MELNPQSNRESRESTKEESFKGFTLDCSLAENDQVGTPKFFSLSKSEMLQMEEANSQIAPLTKELNAVKACWALTKSELEVKSKALDQIK